MQKESTQLIRTFTIGFTDKSADETKYAKVAATHFGTLHREFTVTSDIQSIFSKVAWYYDEPFADHSAIPTWFLCEQTRREVTVALTGDGGDELFAGYDRHRAANFRKRFDCLPLFCRRFLANHVKNMIPSSSGRSFFRKLQRFLEGLGMNQTECFLQWVSIINRKHRQKLYTNDFSKQLSGFDSIDHLKNAIKCCDKRDPATQLSLIDLQTYLPGAIMTKVDIASMAHSLECRSPFLDYRVVELASKIPLHYKIKGNISKTLLRNTYKNLIPPIIAKRHDKMGFSAPMFQWFRGPFKNLMNDTLLNSHAVLQGMFQREQIIRILSEHSSGQFDHSQMIWALFMFELWTRTWLENNSTI
jgi:asparagine synthase (glutamine-hydrolysing)